MRIIPVLLFCAALLPAQSRTPIIFDTDIGDDIDDALALALALQSPELEVLAVTTVIDDVDNRTRLALKEIKLYGRGEIPLGTGASEPLLDPIRTAPAPQFKLLTDADKLPVTPRAADLIIRTLMSARSKVTLVPVGPLTNIALALKLDPRIKSHIERIVLMGGAFFPSRAEYNIMRDHVAAQIVFSSGVPITAVGLDVTTKCKLQGEDLARLRAADNPASKFLVQLIELWQNGKPNQYPTLHDPLAVATALRPGIVETQSGSVQVEKDGTTIFTRQDTPSSTQVARDVNVREFLDLFVKRLSTGPRSGE